MTTSEIPTYLREEQALARAVLYRFLSTAFRYPDPSNLSDLDELADGALAAGATLDEMGAELSGRLEALMARRRSASPDELTRGYAVLFGHSAQGTCPLYETEYGECDEGLQQPHQLGDLSGFYAAFGLVPSRRIHERMDHVSIECEFLAFLYQKESYALSLDSPERLDVTVDAERKFLRHHLGRWAPAFSRRVLEQAGDGFYGKVASFAVDLLTADCRFHGVGTGPEQLHLRKIPDDPEDTYTCPMSKNP